MEILSLPVETTRWWTTDNPPPSSLNGNTFNILMDILLLFFMEILLLPAETTRCWTTDNPTHSTFHGNTFTLSMDIQSGASSRAKHGGAYFSAVRGSIKDPIAVPGRHEVTGV